MSTIERTDRMSAGSMVATNTWVFGFAGWSPDRAATVCVNILTHRRSPYTITDMRLLPPEKKKALLASGTLNTHPESVRSSLFAEVDFFDPHDRVQVKYEMLRAQSVDRASVTEVCEQFGFSRESFYKIRLAFEEKGFNALFPAKKGRKGPVKLKGEMLEFALDRKRQDPDIDPARLSELIRERFGVRVHRTTVLRATKKKLPASAGQKRRKVHRER